MASPTVFLREMGLSEYEATTYVTLVRQGTSTAKQTASAADVPQSRVYDVFDSLEEMGFVKIQPGRPNKYGPVTPQTALEQYRTYRRRLHEQQLEDVRSLGDEFIEAVGETDDGGSPDPDISWSYPNRHYILEQCEQLTEQSQDEIQMVTTPESFERLLTHHGHLLESKDDAGVTIRAIVAKDRRIDSTVRARAIERMAIRRIEEIEGRLYLYDQKDILLAYRAAEKNGFVGVSTVSNHLYSTLAHFFEVLWDDASPVLDA